MDKLKTCPFCGESLEKASHYYLHPLNDCILCHLAFDMLDDDFEEIVEAWNRRAD